MVDLALAKKIAVFLNEILVTDREAISQLISHRVPCSAELTDHPTVQVQHEKGLWCVGMLGLLNGLCGCYANNGGALLAVMTDDEPAKVVKFDVREGDIATMA